MHAIIVMFDGTDLQGVDREHFAHAGKNPIRLNGEPYPLNQDILSSVSGKPTTKIAPVFQRISKKTKEPVMNKKNSHQEQQHNHEDTDNESIANACDANEDGEREELQSRIAQKTAGFKVFYDYKRKFKGVVELDFKITKINQSTIMGSMWTRHKQLFGENARCGDRCKCILSIPELVVNVVPDQITKQREQREKGKVIETEEELESRMAGVTSHFAPKFMPLLKEEYPDETASQLLDRLCVMWKVHETIPMYGLRCNDTCECEGEWDQHFGRGDKAKISEFCAGSRKKKRQASKLSRLSSQSDKKNADGLIIPKKKPRIDSSKKISNPLEQLPPRNPSGASKRLTLNETYEVVFDYSRPLGGYFRTDKLANGNKCVRIFSICPHGQLTKDSRIKNKTCVESVLSGENKIFIITHEELKSHYDNARRQRRPLKLVFINHGAESLPEDVNINNWNQFKWIGHHRDGWDGGANESATASAALESDLLKEEWVTAVNATVPCHRSKRPTRACLTVKLHHHENNVTKTVSFSSVEPDQFVFDKEDPCTWRKIRTETTHKVNIQIDQIQNLPEQSLADAVQRGSCADLIDELESGITKDPNIVKDIRKHYEYLKQEKTKWSHDPFVHIDIEAKCKVLNIYLNCIHTIEKAMSLSKWYTLDLQVVSIYSEMVKEAAPTAGGSATVDGTISVERGYGLPTDNLVSSFIVFLYFFFCRQISSAARFRLISLSSVACQGNLPPCVYSAYISYSSFGPEKPTFKTHTNPGMILEKRELVINIQERAVGSMPAKKVGTFNFDLNGLVQSANDDGSWKMECRPLSNGYGVLSKGVIKIASMISKSDKDYLEKKRLDTLQEIGDQLNNIRKFNDSHKVNGCGKLSTNMHGIGGATLLHAAIQLKDHGPLIDRIMRLGANPRCRTLRHGTPLSFAQNSLDRAAEKEKFMEAKNASAAAINAQKNQCASLKRVIAILNGEGNSSSNNNDDDVAQIMNNNDNAGRSAGPLLDYGDDAIGDAQRVSAFNNTKKAPPRRSNYAGGQATISDAVRGSSGNLLMQAGGAPLNKLSSSPESSAALQAISGARRSNKAPSIDHATFRSSTAAQQLPVLPNPGWASKQEGRLCMCKFNMKGCYFFSRDGKCKFWHDVLSPLRPGQMSIVATDQHMDPANVKTIERNHLWAAAFLDTQRKQILYAQDIFQCGAVSPQGIVWFQSRKDAADALARTVAIAGLIEQGLGSIRRGSKNPHQHYYGPPPTSTTSSSSTSTSSHQQQKKKVKNFLIRRS
jgi:hypothetical protein